MARPGGAWRAADALRLLQHATGVAEGPAPLPAQRLRVAPGRPVLLMTCRAGLSCQMWWMRDAAAVEVTFAARLLPDWAAIRQGTGALLDGLRRP